MADNIGGVSVSVTPDASGFVVDLTRQILPGARALGDQLGDELSRGIAEKLRRAIGEGLSKGTGSQGAKAGDEFGGAFARTTKQRIEAAFKNLPDAQVGIDTGKASAELAELRAELASLTAFGPKVSDDQALATIDRVKARLDELKASDADVQVRVDAAAASAQLGAIQAQIAALDASEAKMDVTTRKAAGGLGLLGTTIATLGPGLIPLGAAAIGVGGAFAALAGPAVAGIISINKQIQAGTPLGQKFGEQVSILGDNFKTLSEVSASNLLAPFTRSVGQLQGQMPSLTESFGQFAGIAGNIGGNLTVGLVNVFQTLKPLFLEIAQGAQRLSEKFVAFSTSGGLQSFGDYAQSVLPEVSSTLKAVAEAAGNLVAGLAPLGGSSLSILRALSEVIAALPVPVITALAVAFAALKISSSFTSGVGKLTESLSGLTSATGGSGFVGALGKLTPVLPVVGIGISLLGSIASDTAQKQEALVKSAQELGKTLGEGGPKALDAAVKIRELGEATKAAQAEADKANINSNRGYNPYGGGNGASSDQGEATRLQEQYSAAVAAAAVAEGQQKAALDAQSASLGLSSSAAADNAAAMGVTTQQYLAAGQSAANSASQIASQTLAMQFANDAAGLLTLAIDTLNGGNLGVAQTSTAFQSALLGATAAATANTGSLSDNTAAGIAQQQSIQGAAQAAIANAEAVAKQTGSTQAGSDALVANKQALVDNLTASLGGTQAARDKAQAYIDTLIVIPPVTKTKAELDTAAAEANAARLASIYASLRAQGAVAVSTGPNIMAAQAKATGGLITGPGTGTSDSIPIMASHREFMSTAKAVAMPGNLAALNAANRGAQLIAVKPRGYADGGLINTASPQVNVVNTANAVALAPQFDVHVYVGNREITDIVDVRMERKIREANGLALNR